MQIHIHTHTHTQIAICLGSVEAHAHAYTYAYKNTYLHYLQVLRQLGPEGGWVILGADMFCVYCLFVFFFPLYFLGAYI